MGNLTDDMTRLRGEVDALRSDRVRGVKDLASSVLAMRADFASAQAAMAKRTKRDLAIFMSGIKTRVARMRAANADDLAGARLGWRGRGSGIRRHMPLPKGQRAVEPPPPVAEAKEAVEAPRSEGQSLSATPAEPRKKEESVRRNWRKP